MLVVAMLPPLSPVSMLATPSIVMLLEFGRAPFTVKPLTDPISLPAAPFGIAPGTSVAKLKSARPLLAMFVRASLSRVNERSPVVDCSSVTRLVTLTSSVIWPTSSVSVPVANPVIRTDHNVRALERLEPLQRDLQRVGIGSHDREHEATAFVGHCGEGVTLRAACQCDRDARQYSTLSVLNNAGDRCAGGLRVDEGRDGQDQSQNGW